MKYSIKYALVQLSVPSLVVALLMFAGTLAEGSLPLPASLLGCLVTAIALCSAWKELMFLQQRHTRQQQVVVQHVQPKKKTEKSQLRVA